MLPIDFDLKCSKMEFELFDFYLEVKSWNIMNAIHKVGNRLRSFFRVDNYFHCNHHL
jgi:hypothetical protein